MNDLPDDMINELCLKCGDGRYKETSLWDDWEGTVHCSKCDHPTDRHPNRTEFIPEGIVTEDDDEEIICPKCGYNSGNSWDQCDYGCPMEGSPHYKPMEELGEYKTIWVWKDFTPKREYDTDDDQIPF